MTENIIPSSKDIPSKNPNSKRWSTIYLSKELQFLIDKSKEKELLEKTK